MDGEDALRKTPWVSPCFWRMVASSSEQGSFVDLPYIELNIDEIAEYLQFSMRRLREPGSNPVRTDFQTESHKVIIQVLITRRNVDIADGFSAVT
jgi:hypothetical protein